MAILRLLDRFRASDEGGDEPKGEDFAGQANAICVDANRKLVEINLELGYEVDEQDAVERLERVDGGWKIYSIQAIE